MSLSIATTSIPMDESPLPDDVMPSSEGPFNKDFPHSTYEHPFGYFPNSDGSPDFSRPRSRKPHGYEGEFDRGALGGGSVKSGGTKRATAASSSQAETAAQMLATMNSLIGMSLAMFGMPLTAQQMGDANEDFRKAATDALLNDPALCRKILSAGANTGKAQLIMAYVGLGAQIGPIAYLEMRAKKDNVNDD